MTICAVIAGADDFVAIAHFAKTKSRLRKGRADENFSTLRRTALSLLKQEKTVKCGVKNKRLKSGWDGDYLAKVVFAERLTVQSH